MKRTELRRVTPLRKVSRKEKSRTDAYHLLRRAYLAQREVCERCRSARATDVHHARGRVGDLLLDPEHWRALCRDCHSWAHANPLQAVAEGWNELRLSGPAQ